MQKDLIIVGQGAAGTFLSWYLLQQGLDILVIDKIDPRSASYSAAGMINPVTGRRIVKSWMIDEIMPFAFEAYTNIGNELGITAIRQKNIINFFPNQQMHDVFAERVEEHADYLVSISNDDQYKEYFNYDFGYGETAPGFLVSTHPLFASWRQQLNHKGLLLDEHFEMDALNANDAGVSYKDFTAPKIVFCDGVHGARNPWFLNLPFASNKGQALLVEIPGLPTEKVYKRSMKLVPLGNDLFWAGASYEWDHTHEQPTEEYRKATLQSLEQWLKLPVKLKDHVASMRPATLERRPFAGFHPAMKSIGILNGLGTKGFSLAPYFAHQLAENIVQRKPIHPLADVARFEKTLSRKV